MAAMNQNEMMMQMMQQMMQQMQLQNAALTARLEAMEAKESAKPATSSKSSSKAVPVPSASSTSEKEAKEKREQSPAQKHASNRLKALLMHIQIKLLLCGWRKFSSKESTGSKAKGTKAEWIVEHVPVKTELSSNRVIYTWRVPTKEELAKFEAVDLDDSEIGLTAVAKECGLLMPHKWMMTYQSLYRQEHPADVREFCENYDHVHPPPASSSKRSSPTTSSKAREISAADLQALREKAKKSPASSAKSEESAVESIRRRLGGQTVNAVEPMVAKRIDSSPIPKASSAASSASSASSSASSEIVKVDRFVSPKAPGKFVKYGTWEGHDVQSYILEEEDEEVHLAIYPFGPKKGVIIGTATKEKGKWKATLTRTHVPTEEEFDAENAEDSEDEDEDMSEDDE